jgi:hypothetical protein
MDDGSMGVRDAEGSLSLSDAGGERRVAYAELDGWGVT